MRKKGWTLGYPVDGTCSVAEVLTADLCSAESSALGSAQEQVVAIEGTLTDGTRFGTRVTPRSATGPDLRRRLLSGAHLVERVTLRLTRRPQSWRHLHGEFNDPLQVARELLTGTHEPWAVLVRGPRRDLWFASDTPASQALAAAVPWTGQSDREGPEELVAASELQHGTWQLWQDLRPGVVVGAGLAGGWQVEEQA